MLTDITLGQYYPGESFIHQMDPRTKIVCTMIFIAAIFLASSPLSYVVITGFLALTIFYSNIPLKLVVKSIKPLWFILIFTFLIHIFTTPGQMFFTFGIIHASKEGIVYGAYMTLRLVYLITFSSLLTYTTSPIVLTDGIEALLMKFHKLGVPAHELAMMMSIALRFIPTLLEETDRIMKAQASRGANFTTGSIMQKAKSMIPAFRRADDLATAMEARCYRGGEGRSKMHQLCYTNKDRIGFAAVMLVTLILLIMRVGI